jgi:hypothetical protein
MKNIVNTNFYKSILEESIKENFIPVLISFYYDDFRKYKTMINSKCGGYNFIFKLGFYLLINNMNFQYFEKTENIPIFSILSEEAKLDNIYKEFINQMINLNGKITPMFHFKYGWIKTKSFFVAKMADLFQHNVDLSLKANNSLNPYYFLNLNRTENHRFTMFLNENYKCHFREISKYYFKIEEYKLNKDESIPKLLLKEGFKMINENDEINELVWYKLKEKMNIDIFERSCPPIRHILEHVGNTKTLWDIVVTFIDKNKIKNLNDDLLQI